MRFLYKTVCLLAATMAWLAAAHFPVQAQPPLVVACPDYPPWRMALEDGSFGGIDIELIQLIAERMKLPLVVERMPWHRAMYMLETGDADMLSNVFKTPARERFLHFLSPPYRTRSRVVFYVPKGKEHRIATYGDLGLLRVGTIKNVLYFPQFDADKALDKQPVMAELQNPRKLLDGHIDTYVETEVAGDWTLMQAKLSNRIDKADYHYELERPVYLVLSRHSRHADRLEEFNRTLRSLIGEGVVERLVDKYLEREGLDP
ncbi:substrate-binding periplasmic protein [Salidesulfovibrio onnuriiensis]|uniref:substrate-binding periplasmic protein n=1 Tax=Salidesulfovibrio onnuriiensis TaxID=2583823 RepID=UPI0011CA3C98|nr:transporter substrate-binding domain-containing protein [Salidesulfovibrio onnuriiensis]